MSVVIHARVVEQLTRLRLRYVAERLDAMSLGEWLRSVRAGAVTRDLMGLVTKNAILLVDRAIVRVREHGETPLQAILEAGPERLRPILMTSAAMTLGMFPTAISNAEGSEFRAPMAIAVIGGVISSTLLSLIVVPVFYLTIENMKAWLGRLGRRKGQRATRSSNLPKVMPSSAE